MYISISDFTYISIRDLNKQSLKVISFVGSHRNQRFLYDTSQIYTYNNAILKPPIVLDDHMDACLPTPTIQSIIVATVVLLDIACNSGDELLPVQTHIEAGIELQQIKI